MKKQKADRKIKKALKDLKQAIVRLKKVEGKCSFNRRECAKLRALDDSLHSLWRKIAAGVNAPSDRSRFISGFLGGLSMPPPEVMERLHKIFLERASGLHNPDPEFPSEIEP